MAKQPVTFKQRAAQGTVAGMLMITIPFTAMREGLDLNPYWDKLGQAWTICYGETVGVTQHSPRETPESCKLMLSIKLKIIGLRVDQMVTTPMSNERWAGLTDFAYNVGLGAFKSSTLLKKINAGDPLACDELRRWTYVGKIDCKIKANKCPGLPDRREGERKLCMVE